MEASPEESPSPDPSPQDVQVPQVQHKLQALLANHGAGSVSIGRQEAAEVLGWLNTGQREEVGRQLLSWIQSQCAAMDAGESVRQRLLMEFEESIKDIWAPPGGQTLRGSEALGGGRGNGSSPVSSATAQQVRPTAVDPGIHTDALGGGRGNGSSPVSSATAQQVPFFQQQGAGRHCGMHALNNILGSDVVTTTDMMEGAEACARAYVSEEGHGAGNRVTEHAEKDGNYSLEVLKYVLEKEGYSLDELDESVPAAADLERAKGFLQHRPGAQDHWMTYRYYDGAIWRLDSLNKQPEQITAEQLTKELSENRTFAIRARAHG
ncbi:unnamed protein product [Symbiodinium sp. KB8]|nr:unnamed protein product [Symbiodinium sp. KB8]